MENSSKKLIILNGFAASGKTTIAKKYIEQHPLSLLIEGDEIISNIGQWITHEDEARQYTFALTKSLIKTHLDSGKSVIVPYLLVNADHAEAFERIAKENNALFFEIFLSSDKKTAIDRLLERGLWGEPGAPAITEKDGPIIEQLYQTMIAETAKRTKTIIVQPIINNIEYTYICFLEAIKEVNKKY